MFFPKSHRLREFRENRNTVTSYLGACTNFHTYVSYILTDMGKIRYMRPHIACCVSYKSVRWELHFTEGCTRTPCLILHISCLIYPQSRTDDIHKAFTHSPVQTISTKHLPTVPYRRYPQNIYPQSRTDEIHKTFTHSPVQTISTKHLPTVPYRRYPQSIYPQSHTDDIHKTFTHSPVQTISTKHLPTVPYRRYPQNIYPQSRIDDIHKTFSDSKCRKSDKLKTRFKLGRL
jgi:hypothetical protein